jgi:hypothetical protein
MNDNLKQEESNDWRGICEHWVTTTTDKKEEVNIVLSRDNFTVRMLFSPKKHGKVGVFETSEPPSQDVLENSMRWNWKVSYFRPFTAEY